MCVDFRIDATPEDEARYRRETAVRLVGLRKQLDESIDALRVATAAGEHDRVAHLERYVLPPLLQLAMICGLKENPAGIREHLVIKAVKWKGEPALQHLQSLGFRRPASKKQLRKRVTTFVSKLVSDGKYDILASDLFELTVTWVAGLSQDSMS